MPEMDIKDKLLDNLHKHMDVPGFLGAVMDDILEPALEKIVNDTSNPFDNILKDAVYPPLEAEIKKRLKEIWDDIKPDPMPASDEDNKEGELV